MSTTGTVVTALAVVIGYGCLFGPPLVVISRMIRKKLRRSG